VAGTLLKTIQLLQSAVDELKIPMSLRDIERIGVMVNKAMSTQARSFHTAEHIFNLVRPGRPLQTMAAIFHDIVYFTIDQGFIPEIEAILGEYIYIQDRKVYIRDDLDPETICVRGALGVFGFIPGDELPAFGGMNEFLSTLVFIHEFQDTMGHRELLEVIAYIEATIPFRPPNTAGQTPAEALAQRLMVINQKYGVGVGDDDIIAIVQRAVLFANTDVENFAEEDVAAFLDNTWKLLPETNPSLRTTGLYTVKNYRIALQKMEGFMNFLDPGLIYSSYHGVPAAEELENLNYRAKRNVLAARDYLGIKLLTTGILEAIADISGGDVPIALLMGDISDEESLQKFESMLPSLEVQKGAAIASTVFNLLAFGRREDSSFDLNRSPLAKFIYLHIGTSHMKKYLTPLADMFKDDITAEQFLDQLPLDLVSPVVRACAEMAFTRRHELTEFIDKRTGS
jgi:hypothetical protein